MDSTHYWYRKFYNGFLKKFNIDVYVNDQFSYTYPHYHFSILKNSTGALNKTAVFFDQEPLYSDFFDEVTDRSLNNDKSMKWVFSPFTGRMFITSEKSDIVDHFCRTRKFKNVYYFFHAFAAIDWYRNYWKQDIFVNFEHEYLYVAYQHLINPKRLHRVDLMCRFFEKDLTDRGLISFVPPPVNELETMIGQNDRYGESSLKIFNEQKHRLSCSYVDTENVHGALSTNIDIENSQKAFLQIVTETVFYANKLHLTEKVFKPIVCKQPFLLLAAPGNLEYLKSYGFRTFSDFWDEGYDLLEEPGARVEAVVKIVEDLSKKSHSELNDMKKSMADILEYNFNHFYFDLKHIAANELIENLKLAFRDSNIKASDSDWKDLYRTLTF